MPADEALKEQVFKVWYRCGCNVNKACEILLDLNITPPARQTIYRWRDSEGWQERADALASVDKAAEDIAVTGGVSTLLVSLRARINEYETYFETAKAPDAQKTFAYTGLTRLVFEMIQSSQAYKRGVFLEFFEDMRAFLSRRDEAAAEGLDKLSNEYLEHINLMLSDKV